MKKITLLLLFVSTMALSQVNEKGYLPANPVTTEKEYNYLTVGLKIQLDSGLDVIDGYELENFRVMNVSNYTFTVKYLKEKSTQKTKAVSVVIDSNVTGNKYYVCIPVRNSDLVLKYTSYVNQFDLPLSKSYAVALGIIYADTVTFN